VTPTASTPPAAARWWRPTAGLTWQWQLTGALDLSVAVDVYDIDAVDATSAQVASLHAAGRRAICYISAGSYENWRPDAARFAPAVLGSPLDGWPGERWLDIRRWDVLQPIMADRMAMCAAKGFDGVEPDNIDGYTNTTGFALTAADQLAYNRRLADLAHAHGLGVGLKNDIEQVAALAPFFDFAVNEECARYAECEPLAAFIAANKPVFHVEYELAVTGFCPAARQLGLSSMRKRLSLDAWRQPC